MQEVGKGTLIEWLHCDIGSKQDTRDRNTQGSSSPAGHPA